MKRNPRILCVIPARLQSTRLPRKPLALIRGKPMIQRTYEAACACPDLHMVIVATDSIEVSEIIEKIGGHVEMTPENLQTGSDRVALVAERFPEYSIVVNLQGDEPFVTPEMLSALVKPYLDCHSISQDSQNLQPVMTTLACPLNFESDYTDPNIVKVIYDLNHDAIYFSRSPIPYFRNKPAEDVPLAMHLGLYAYTRDFLLKYTKLPQTILEKAELLEQLRVLENGYKIKVCLTQTRILEINTPEDLQQANSS